MLYPKQTNCSENGSIDSLISSIDCRLSKLANTMYNNTVFMLNKTISGTEMFDLIQYKRILYYKQINPSYVDCFSVNQIASQVKRFTANCSGNCNGNDNNSNSNNNVFPAPPIRTTTTTSSTTCPPTTSTTSSTTTNTTTCKPSGLTFFTLTTGIVYNSVTYNFSEMSLIDICNLLVNICYPYTGEFTYTTVFGETTAIETGNIIFDPLSGPCAFLPDGIYLNGEPGDSCGTVASIFEVVDGVITEVVTTCNVVTTTTTTTAPPEEFRIMANGVTVIDDPYTTASGIQIIASLAFQIEWEPGVIEPFNSGTRNINHTYLEPYTGPIKILSTNLSTITRLEVQSYPHPSQSLSVTTIELSKLDGLLVFIAIQPNGLFVTGDVDNLPNSLTNLTTGNNNLSGLTSNLPPLLTTCTITGTNTIDGNTLGLPDNLTYLNIQGINTISGLTSDIPRTNNTCIINGNNTISGTTFGLPPAVNQIEIRGNLPYGNTIDGDVNDIFPSKNIWLYGKNTVYGNVSGFKLPTTFISIIGNNTISGDVIGLPRDLITLNIEGNNSISGNFTDLPPLLTTIILRNNNNTPNTISVFGNAANLPINLTQLTIQSTGLLSGNLYYLPLPIRQVNVNMDTDLTYTQNPPNTPRNWAANYIDLGFPGATGTTWAGFTQTETDNLLNDIYDNYSTSSTAQRFFRITCASNPPRTSNSEFAYQTLVNNIGLSNVNLT